MIDGLKPYPTYKDSGVPWLGEVPGHWEVRRLKRVCSRSALYGANTVATSYTATGIRFLRTTDITEDGHLKSAGIFLPEETVRDYLLAEGDLLISRSGTIGRSFLYDSKMHGPCAYAGYLVRFVPAPEILPRYVFLFTKTQAFVGFLRVMAISSTIENVNGAKYANAELPLPPLPEQAAIVRFLDHADRRIRRYIRAKQKLIKLLEEQKQAIIHRAVTRGLDPHVRLKPSGVEWLEDVPEHWEVVGLRNLATKFGSGITPRGGATVYQESGIPFLRSQNVHFDGLRLAGVARITSELHESLSGTHVRPGDVLLNITGASIGRVCAVPAEFTEGNVNQHVCIIRTKTDRVLPEFLAAFLSTPFMQREIRFEQNGASREGLTLHSIRGFKILVPTTEEQTVILAGVQEQCRELALTIASAASEIDLLREFRTRLIADLVTGKLDVREAAARLPEETEEPEPLDEIEDATDAEEGTADDLGAIPEEAEA